MPLPLAVTVVVPGAKPVSWSVDVLLPPDRIVAVAGTVATPGALLVKATGIGATVAWLLGYAEPSTVRRTLKFDCAPTVVFDGPPNTN